MVIASRICILKGIYPREPKHKPNKTQTYYHAKDIAYISHEPIIDYFRKMKAFLKKVYFSDWLFQLAFSFSRPW